MENLFNPVFQVDTFNNSYIYLNLSNKLFQTNHPPCSSFNFLTANSKAHVYSFDLGSHTYVAKMNSTIGRLFPSRRHHLVIGDSTKTVPKLVEEKKLPLCDVAFVDGGHVYPVARADMANFATHMSKDNLIIFDDYPTNWGVSFGKAWEEVLTGGMLKKREKIKFNEVAVCLCV